MSEKLSWLGFILLLGAFSAHALDSDGNGITDAIEASTGADPFSRYAVSAGSSHTCALDDTGMVCWGDNKNGQTTAPALMIDLDGHGVSG